MFTGIIETTGTIADIISNGTNKTFWVDSPISADLKVDQSVAHSGVCLTVEKVEHGKHQLTAIEETLQKTNLNTWTTGTVVNIERCIAMNGRLDGHIVQGHVDTVATCLQVVDKDGSWKFTFSFDPQFASLVIEKGSIAINGTSLTVFNVTGNTFTVAIIPYTYQHTNIHQIKEGSLVNIEFDMIGKYVARLYEVRQL